MVIEPHFSARRLRGHATTEGCGLNICLYMLLLGLRQCGYSRGLVDEALVGLLPWTSSWGSKPPSDLPQESHVSGVVLEAPWR